MKPRHFILRDPGVLQNCIRFLQALNPDVIWDVRIKPYKKDRTLAQNRIYWEWITIIGAETGYDKDDLHEALAGKFLAPSIARNVLGEMVQRRASTAKLKVGEFTAYLEAIERFAAADLGIILPRPEDLYREAMGR